MELVLIKYQGRNWTGRMRVSRDMPEFFSVCFTCDTTEGLTLDVGVHVSHMNSKIILSVYSPYWIINKTSRVLQYRAEDTCVKHPSDFRDVILFSFKKKNLFSKNKVGLCSLAVFERKICTAISQIMNKIVFGLSCSESHVLPVDLNTKCSDIPF